MNSKKDSGYIFKGINTFGQLVVGMAFVDTCPLYFKKFKILQCDYFSDNLKMVHALEQIQTSMYLTRCKEEDTFTIYSKPAFRN